MNKFLFLSKWKNIFWHYKSHVNQETLTSYYFPFSLSIVSWTPQNFIQYWCPLISPLRSPIHRYRQFPSALGTWRTYCSQSQLDELPLLDQATNSVYSIARNSISLALGTKVRVEEWILFWPVKDLDQRDERIKEASNAFKQVDSFAYQQTEDELGKLISFFFCDIDSNFGKLFIYFRLIADSKRLRKRIRNSFCWCIALHNSLSVYHHRVRFQVFYWC